ncbi:alpha--mannosylglycoprotein 6-beta-n-acetylglucosaminyltransferase a [Moniliophthora roreri]|nr:alpha--mannosylglycoprotein 6-beta-n-acetylglucosaminyltransferase a [Moniliophthora roreri]
MFKGTASNRRTLLQVFGFLGSSLPPIVNPQAFSAGISSSHSCIWMSQKSRSGVIPLLFSNVEEETHRVRKQSVRQNNK